MTDPRERESIQIGLRSPDEELRRLAVEQIGELPADEAVPMLTRCFGDDSWRVRKAAVERLVAAPESWRVADALLAGLADESNAGRRNSSVEALVRIGRRAVPALLGATADADADVRRLALDALAAIGDESVAPRFVACAADPDPNVRAAVADGLGVLGGPEAEVCLLASAVDPGEDRIVRFSALRALARLETVLDPKLLAPAIADDRLRPTAFAVLGHAEDEDALGPLLDGLAQRSRLSREAAIEALLRWIARLDAERSEELVARVRARAAASPGLARDAISRLESADLPTRLVLVQLLGLLQQEDAVLPLLRAAHDEALSDLALASIARLGAAAEAVIAGAVGGLEARTRRLACDVLGRTSGATGERLLLLAMDDPEPEVRCQAAEALGRRGTEAAIAVVVRRLGAAAEDDDPESDEEVRAAGDALAVLVRPHGRPDPERVGQAVSLLAQRLDDSVEAVRQTVAAVLGRIGRANDAPLLAALLADPSARVRRAAVEALAILGPGIELEPVRVALGDESSMVRIGAASTLAACGEADALVSLARVADDADPWVRAAGLRAAGALAVRVPETLAGAISLLETRLADVAPVAVAVVEALREIGGVDGARAVCAVLGRGEPELVQAAVRCIGQDGDTAALECLIPLVGHDHWTVRAEAIQTLAERRVVRAVPAILRRLETEQDDFVRAAILRALGRLEA